MFQFVYMQSKYDCWYFVKSTISFNKCIQHSTIEMGMIFFIAFCICWMNLVFVLLLILGCGKINEKHTIYPICLNEHVQGKPSFFHLNPKTFCTFKPFRALSMHLHVSTKWMQSMLMFLTTFLKSPKMHSHKYYSMRLCVRLLEIPKMFILFTSMNVLVLFELQTW